MKSIAKSLGLFAVGALASPLATRQSTNIDSTVLQFALTLEHLENNFYHGALQKFSLQDFLDAGYSATYYNNLKYISYDEQQHVQLLTSALSAAGVTPVAACQYNFPYTDVFSFVTLSSILEGVGVSAYLGGAPLITSKGYLTVAGSILVAEALHTSMQRGAIGEVPMANPYGTPLDPTSVYTLAANFIVQCPPSNAALPFKPFPALSYSSANTCEGPDCATYQPAKRDNSWGQWEASSSSSSAAPTTTAWAKPTASPESSMGWNEWSTVTVVETKTEMSSSPTATVTVKDNKGYMGNAPVKSSAMPPSAGNQIMLTAASAIPAGSFVTFVSGLSVVSVPAVANGNSTTVAIPAGIAGQSYAFITSSDDKGTFTDANVLFGPAIVEVNPAPAAIDYSIN